MNFFTATGWRNGYDYPYVLVSTKYASQAIRQRAAVLILDSDIRDPKGTNEKVALASKKFAPDYVVPKDKFRDVKATISSVRAFTHLDYSGDLLIPLQPDGKGSYETCFTYLHELGDYFALGGLADLPDAAQLIRLKAGARMLFRSDKKCHLFGIFPSRWAGGEESLLWKFLRSDGADMVTSMDSVVCETAAATGNAFDLQLHRHQMNTKGVRNTEYKHALASLNCWAVQLNLNRVAKSTFQNFGGNLRKLKTFPSPDE